MNVAQLKQKGAPRQRKASIAPVQQPPVAMLQRVETKSDFSDTGSRRERNRVHRMIRRASISEAGLKMREGRAPKDGPLFTGGLPPTQEEEVDGKSVSFSGRPAEGSVMSGPSRSNRAPWQPGSPEAKKGFKRQTKGKTAEQAGARGRKSFIQQATTAVDTSPASVTMQEAQVLPLYARYVPNAVLEHYAVAPPIPPRPFVQKMVGVLFFIDVSGYMKLVNSIATIALSKERRRSSYTSKNFTSRFKGMNINEIMKTAKMGNPEESFNFSKKNEALDKAIDSFTRASTGEETSIVLNEYFTKILDIIRDFGGDVIKFAGDALLVMWKSHVVTTNESFEELMHHAKVRSSYLEAMTNACACSKEIQATCDNYRPQGKEAKGIILRNKITITAGEISGFYIGGVGDRMEYFIAGTPLEEIGEIADNVQPGETIVHSDVYVQLSQLSTSGFKFSEKEGGSKMWLLRDCPRKDRSALELPTRTNPKFFDIVGQYLPSVVKANLNGQITQAKSGSQPILAELRRVSIMFVMFTGMTYRGAQALAQVQDVITACQKTLYRFDGSLRQFLVEDKGSVLIAAFGVPPHGTENFAWRAVSAAMEVRFTLDELNVSCSIGVTTGNVFCGNIGSKDRCEYSYVGDVVNMSARLMQKAQFHGYILVDEDTRTATKDSIQYHPKITLKIKGKNTSVTAYPPKLNKNSLKGVMNDLNAGVQEPTQEANNATLFGRADTIASLHKLLPQARKNGVSVLLHGETGVGKSVLLRELMIKCKEEKFRVYEGKMSNLNAASSPLFTLRSLIIAMLECNVLQRISHAVYQRQSSLNFDFNENTAQQFLLPANLKEELKEFLESKDFFRGTPAVQDVLPLPSGSGLNGSKPSLSSIVIEEGDEDEEDEECDDEVGDRDEERDEAEETAEKNEIAERGSDGLTSEEDVTNGKTGQHADSGGSEAELEDSKKIEQDVYTALEHIFSMSLSAPPKNGKENPKDINAILRYFIKTIVAYMTWKTQQPMLILLDSMEKCDSESWSLLSCLHGMKDVIVALACRTDNKNLPPVLKQVETLPGFVCIPVEPLDYCSVQLTIADRLQCKSVPKVVTDYIYTRSNGNPLFAEEVAHRLLNLHAVIVSEGKVFLGSTNLTQIPLPDIVTDVIRAKVDGLAKMSPALLAVVKIAAAIGHMCELAQLEYIVPLVNMPVERKELPWCLQKLIELKFVRIEFSDEKKVFSFVEEAVQEVVYSLLSYVTRQQIHSAAAKWYEEKVDGDTYYSVMAFHYECAQEYMTAARCLINAGVACVERDTIASQQFFTEGLNLVEDEALVLGNDELVRLYKNAAQAYYYLGTFEESINFVHKGLDLLRDEKKEFFKFPKRILMNEILQLFLKRSCCLPEAFSKKWWKQENFEDDAQLITDLCELYLLLFDNHIATAKPNLAVEAAFKANHLAERIKDLPQGLALYGQSSAGIALALKNYLGPYTADALDVNVEFAEDHLLALSPKQLVSTRYYLSLYEFGSANFMKFSHHLLELHILCANKGDVYHEGVCNMLRGVGNVLIGHYDEAMVSFGRLFHLGKESGVKLLRKLGLLGVILTNVFQGNYEEAKSNLSKYKEIHYVVKGQEVSFDKVLIGFKCYVLYQHGDRQLSLKLIRGLIQQQDGTDTNVSPEMYPSLFFASETLFMLVEVSYTEKNSQKLEALKQDAKKALKLLRKFQKHFALGETQYLLCQMLYVYLFNKDLSKAEKLANLGCKKALRLGWDFEMGRICRRMGFLGGEVRLNWVQRAARHFRAAGAYYDLEIVENALEDIGRSADEAEEEFDGRV